MTNHVNRKSPVALVIVDVVNHFEFPDGGRLLRQAMAIVQPLAVLSDTREERPAFP